MLASQGDDAFLAEIAAAEASYYAQRAAAAAPAEAARAPLQPVQPRAAAPARNFPIFAAARRDGGEAAARRQELEADGYRMPAKPTRPPPAAAWPPAPAVAPTAAPAAAPAPAASAAAATYAPPPLPPQPPPPPPPPAAPPMPLDESTADEWVLPQYRKRGRGELLSARPYQRAMAKVALLHNTLVALPTGLGKTYVAAVVMYNFLRWFPGGKAVFLAPTKPLVHQQARRARNSAAQIPRNYTSGFGAVLQRAELSPPTCVRPPRCAPSARSSASRAPSSPSSRARFGRRSALGCGTCAVCSSSRRRRSSTIWRAACARRPRSSASWWTRRTRRAATTPTCR